MGQQLLEALSIMPSNLAADEDREPGDLASARAGTRYAGFREDHLAVLS